MREISKKAQETRLRWYGRIMTRNRASDERKVLDMEVQGRRGKENPRLDRKIAYRMT